MTERDFKGIVHFQECDYLPVESQKTRQNKQFASYLEGLLRKYIYMYMYEGIYEDIIFIRTYLHKLPSFGTYEGIIPPKVTVLRRK